MAGGQGHLPAGYPATSGPSAMAESRNCPTAMVTSK